ncbi:MAG: hypothetical protein AB8G11_15015 [Saprospiraceae bacterium]
MKNLQYILLGFILLLANSNIFGQIELEDTYTHFDDEWATATVIIVPMEDNELEDAWEDYLEENFELELNKVASKKDTTLYISKNVIRNNLSDTVYSIYTKIVERQDGNSDLYTFWAYDENRFLNTEEHPDKVEDTDILMADFAQKAYAKYYKQEIEAVKQKQKRLEKEYNRLERRNDKLDKRNERYAEKQKDYDAQIELNEENKDDNQMKMRQLEIMYEGLDSRIGVLEYQLNSVLISSDKG